MSKWPKEGKLPILSCKSSFFHKDFIGDPLAIGSIYGIFTDIQ